MPDNPRYPSHQDDSPSSRPSGGVTNPPGSFGGNYNPPPPKNESSHSKLSVRNIVIGSIVTIVTSTIIFYLTQYLKKPEGSEYERMKKATTAAWNSYIGYENIYVTNLMSLNKNPGTRSLDSLLKSFKTESDKFIRDVGDLAREKNIDRDFKKMLIRRVENERNSFPTLEAYYTKMTRINTSEATPKEKITASVDEMSSYIENTNGMYERAINEIKGITEVLAKRYDQKFSINEFQIVQLLPQITYSNDSMLQLMRSVKFDSLGNIFDDTAPVRNFKEKDIIGFWNADGSVFTFEKNGKMTWVIGGGQKAIGTWKIEDGKLRLDGEITPIGQKGYWLFHVSEITESSIVLTSVKDDDIYYALVRIITQ